MLSEFEYLPVRRIVLTLRCYLVSFCEFTSYFVACAIGPITVKHEVVQKTTSRPT